MRKSFLFIFCVIITCAAIWYFSNIFLYILIAGILSLIGQPINHFFRKIRIGNYNTSESFSASVTFLLLLLAFTLLAVIFVPLITEEAQILSSIDRNATLSTLQKPMQEAEQALQHLHINYNTDELQVYLQEKLTSILTITNISIFFNQFIAALGNFFVAFFSISFLTFFFLKDDKKIVRAILSSVPEDYLQKAQNVLIESQYMLKRYFIGILIEILLVMVLLAIGLSVTGIKYALLIALFAGIVNVIPYVGPLIGVGFALIIGLTTNTEISMLSVLIKILIVFPIVNLFDAFVLQPLIYASSVKAHPLEIFLVILAGATIGGIGGMLLAVPAYTVLRVIAREFFINFRFVKQLTKKFDKSDT